MGDEALEQVAQGSCGCPLPGSVQGQVGWGFEQPGLVEGVFACGGGLELDDLQGPSQPKPFYDSMINHKVKSQLPKVVNTVQWKCDRDQKGQWWLRCFMQGCRAPLWGMMSIPCTWQCRHPVVLLQTGWSIFILVSGLWQTEGSWHGVQLCFHWLEAEQVKWSSVMLLAVKHNAPF